VAFVLGALLATSIMSGRLQDEHARSDLFWRLVSPNAMAAESYETPREMAAEADLVVVGKIEKVENGREWVANPDLLKDPIGVERAYARFALLTVRVEEVLGQSSFEPSDGTVPVEVYLNTGEVLDQLLDLKPDGRAIFALRNKGSTDSTKYFRLVNDTQGLVREFGGKAHLSSADELSSGFAELEGMPFSKVADLMRASRSE
jgi:hypothetical protein